MRRLSRRVPTGSGVGRWGLILAGLLGPLVTGSAVVAQVPRLIAEGRVGAALPTGALGEDTPEGGADPGATFGVGFALAVRGGLYVHLGFSQHRFVCSEGCSALGDLTATGFDLALRYSFVAGPVQPWFRVGALPYTVEGRGEGSDGDPVSDHTWGVEGGAGLNVPLSENVHLSPGLRYVAMDPRFESDVELRVRGWVADVGLVWAF